MRAIERITILGGGTMGLSIAKSFAMAGQTVTVYEPNNEVRDAIPAKVQSDFNLLKEQGLLAELEVQEATQCIHLASELEAAVEQAQLVIESVPEQLDLKQEVFAQLLQLAPNDAILASNTSSLNLLDVIGAFSESQQQRCLQCHWFNPGHLIPLVELSDFAPTSEETVQAVEQLLQKIGKKTVRVHKNVAGLIANRLQAALVREALALYEEEVASPQDLSRAFTYGPAVRFARTGVLEVVDLGGLDVWSAVLDNLLPQISQSQEASPLLSEKVKHHQLGVKTGAGLFEYKDPEQRASDFYLNIIKQVKSLQQ
ncbi:3-hydroxyacyl-CoA dehydrogenase family protein [Brackiella oedipodis]|uniref:3-hydroxyacyl-CoA dehydrogenase family protein n=1 Tax=Brackiella oedipodis TaxID=124225 RepID=UPI00056E0FCE|nr:3-hydroxyacyl-CoA dehydrogenase NAD-binding domain-containing protein [Brackiella oedipodis]